MLLTLCETVWSAYEQKLLLGRAWEYVQGWIRQLGESPDFRRAVKWCGDTSDYTDEFMQTVRRLVRQGHENLKARTEAVGA